MIYFITVYNLQKILAIDFLLYFKQFAVTYLMTKYLIHSTPTL